MDRIAVYPGSFDPITNGHVDIIKRALQLFDHVRVAVAYNKDKPGGLFTPEERMTMITEVVGDFGERVSVDSFYGLLVDYARETGAQAVIRGLRAVADFDYEFQMALMNRHLCDDVETVFLMADEAHFYTSSSLTKEVAALGGDISGQVPASVMQKLEKKFRKRS
ncbi:MAG: pantetheine-phosphate adenylyltransferase [Candidatus Binatia bacterium]